MPSLPPSDRTRDAYYTPEGLAKEVVAAASSTPRSVMDPAVGDGSLLRAATARWPDVHVVGLDVDRGQLNRTRAGHPGWSLGRVDMFSERSRAASALWQSSGSAIDLMLLNPPFSYRGGRSKRVTYEGEEHALTPASAFVALALTRLAPNGELLALLPAGVLSLERDAAFWSAVASERTVETIAQFASTAFAGTRTRSILVSLRPQRVPQLAEVVDLQLRPSHCVELIRGRVPVHALAERRGSGSSAPFLHTRDLSNLLNRATTESRGPVSLASQGPFVTLPRVGRVRAEHIKVISSPQAVVLSDCVFALRADSSAELVKLQELLLANIEALQLEYVGGCAPYLTIRRLVHFLAQRGYCCHHVAASSASQIVADEFGAHASADVLDCALSELH